MDREKKYFQFTVIDKNQNGNKQKAIIFYLMFKRGK